MQGDELKATRKMAGMSQADLATAIGMSRETVGQMERGQAPIELRTELAVKYICGQRPYAAQDLLTVWRDVKDTIDSIAERGAVSSDDIQALVTGQSDWSIAAGGGAGGNLLHNIIGTANTLAAGFKNEFVIRDLMQYRDMWATLEPERWPPVELSARTLQRAVAALGTWGEINTKGVTPRGRKLDL